MDTLRQEFIDNLGKLLVGPSKTEEIISERPDQRYLYGFLWPVSKQRISFLEDDQDTLDLHNGKDNNDEEAENKIQSGYRYKQASMGLSFNLPSTCESICLRLTYGRYCASKREDGSRNWVRRHCLIETSLSLVNGRHDLSDGIYAHITSSIKDALRIITLSIVNDPLCGDGVESQVEATLFQPELELTIGKGLRFCRRPLNMSTGSYEARTYEMLYREKRPVAFGHGVAALWDQERQTIRTSFIPTYELPSIDKDCDKYFGCIAPNIFYADYLGSASREVVCEGLEEFISVYSEWIENQRSILQNLDHSMLDYANANIETCSSAHSRLKSALLALREDDSIFAAFQQANLSISLQASWKCGSEISQFKWRPFQLAFFLLVVESYISEQRASRDIVDLLWFPTGGGKTEAYLAIIAFVLFRGSYRNSNQDDPGTQVIIRYTLRLLTRQQFERAAAVVCAANVIRISDPRCHDLSKQFSIGLWIGDESTPNKRDDARNALRASEIQKSDPRQLITCPSCKSPLHWEFRTQAPVQPKCSNVDCDLNGLLPVYTVDEDIYEVRPSVILGTSDKFVALVRNEHSGSLFRSRTGKPPELILQDELHLISGPLGSLAGIFESAIDIICGNGIRPKIIGSTATIKNASDQIQALFDRSSFQFPPFGLSASDSCFALEDRSAPGRLYIGTSTTGRSAKFALQAVAASTYYVGREIHAKYKDDFTGQADTYTTLVSYYNSLKELGGAMVLFQDDVGETLRSIARSAGSQMYSMTNICELTSNRSQDELQSILIDLELNSNDPNSIDACLASNMLSVGVDVSRLGLMLMNGQPKTRSEYIQATSRVGRNYPGIVVTLYNDTKVRDKSAYEGFTAIHENMYKEVEVTSVTPFSPQCLDRALATVVVAACRHRSSIALNNPEIQTFLDVFDNVSEELCERCQRIDSANLSYLKQKLMDIKSIWLEANPTVYCEFFPRIGSIPLLVAAEQAARMEEDQYFLTMITNLRSVESQSLVRPMPDTRRG